jgi:hypothetical protein
MNRKRLIAVSAVLLFTVQAALAQVFFRQYWAEFDKVINNNPHDTRTRVNDAQLSLHETFGHRTEARINGLLLIDVPEDLFGLDGADLYLELWGGHPRTENKHFYLNGRGPYPLPEKGTVTDNCTYTYPAVPLKVEHLVYGKNAFQFACDRGNTFWGHYIIDNAAVRCYLKPGHLYLAQHGLEDFSARVQLDDGPILKEKTPLSLSYAPDRVKDIVAVEYFGRYLGYDDNGDGIEDDWHGYTFEKIFVNHIGRTAQSPFELIWDTGMIPDQGKPMAIRALVELKNGLYYWTPVHDGLLFPAKRDRVMLFKCTDMPAPFWSRADREAIATLLLPDDLSRVKTAQLVTKIWDGGEGTIENPFAINGFPYGITSGMAIHDVVFTRVQVSPKHLNAGENSITLLSNTEHHGIEMLLPGPCLIVRFDR